MKKYWLIMLLIIFIFLYGCNNKENNNHIHELIHHEGKTATCTEIGWNEYDTCSSCDYTTYHEIPALNHVLINHEGKPATCTESGWSEYDTCTRCSYTTYQELPALDHNLIHHEAKDPTYMQVGWSEYDTCSRCNYTTYQEISTLIYNDYKDKTIMNRDFSDYDDIFEDVLYAKTRTSNTLVVYNNHDYIKTNIYGKEALINEYGRVIDINTNVDVTQGYMVLSAHGSRVAEITSLNIGDYVIYYGGVVYVYRGNTLPFKPIVNDIFFKFYDLERYLETLDDGIEKSQIKTTLDSVISYLEKIYDNEEVSDGILNNIFEALNHYDIEPKKVTEYCNKQEELTEGNNKYKYINNIEIEEEYSLALTYSKTLYYGGFRNADTLVFYNTEYWRERNTYGYEIAIDKNGCVIDKEVLVDLPDEGYILSGHGAAAKFLRTVNMDDFVLIEDGKVYFYRKPISTLFNSLFDSINLIINEINLDYDNGIKHDYELIDNIINEINNQLPTVFNHDIYNIENSLKQYNNISSLVKRLASLTIAYDNDTVHGMWYYPLRDEKENTLEGLSERLDLIKSIGINNIFITPLASDGALFPNSMYVYSPKVQKNNYEGYSNYLECFISLAHSKGIKVTAFTQTFMHYNSLMKSDEDWTYQMEMDGTRSKGSVNYLDICNDNIKQMLYDYYSELMVYDFDGIEYDIIRYSESSLWNYLNVEKINKASVKDPGWTEYSINKFINEYNLAKDSDVKSLVLNSLDIRIKWLEFKENELVTFITNTSKILKDKNPNVIISAAVLSNYDSAKKAYLQDYKKWLDLGILDVVEPMNYNCVHSAFMNVYNDYFNNEYSDKTRMGLSNLLDGNDIIEDFIQLKYSMKYGYVIFSSSLYLNNNDYIKYMQLIYKGDR